MDLSWFASIVSALISLHVKLGALSAEKANVILSKFTMPA